MKVLFVSSGNSKNFNVTPFIKSQGQSINTNSVNVEYFSIIGDGLLGYLNNIKRLNKYVKDNSVDIIHAHYVLSGWVAILAHTGKPIVLSLMGSDAYGDYNGPRPNLLSRYLTLLTYLIQPFVDIIISKSKNIEKYVYFKKKSHIIPNGIDIDSINQSKSIKKQDLFLDVSKTHVLFLGDPNNLRKNFNLVSNAINLLNEEEIELITPYPISHQKVLQYLQVTDVFAMASYMEGSPNVVKEAMACNCPMVVTDVGDAAWVTEGVKGCYISTFNDKDYSKKLKKAIQFSKENGRTNGLDRIRMLKLSSNSIANRIHKLYNSLLK